MTCRPSSQNYRHGGPGPINPTFHETASRLPSSPIAITRAPSRGIPKWNALCESELVD